MKQAFSTDTAVAPEQDEFVVSLVSASRADEPFWNALYGEGDIMEMADYYITPDGKNGRLIELANNGCPLVFHAHGQTLYANGTEKGFLSLQEAVRRMGAFLGDKIEWLKASELAVERYGRDWCGEQ